MKPSLVVAVSGGGRTLANLLNQQDQWNYKVAGVISSSASCGGCRIAEKADLPLFVGDFSAAAQHHTRKELTGWLADLDAQWIALAGFLKKFPDLPEYQTRVINIHPALLPNYGGPGMYGLRVHQAVLNAGDRETGATVHFVNEHYDEGQPIAQIRVDVADLGTAEAIAARVFQAECQIYPKVIDGLTRGQLPLETGILSLSFS
jgi:folate-dependent phosphoribosylglycinamide formyltransferase PurN